jgi:hypothetical protein
MDRLFSPRVTWSSPSYSGSTLLVKSSNIRANAPSKLLVKFLTVPHNFICFIIESTVFPSAVNTGKKQDPLKAIVAGGLAGAIEAVVSYPTE